jgi:hypothetical protein
LNKILHESDSNPSQMPRELRKSLNTMRSAPSSRNKKKEKTAHGCGRRSSIIASRSPNTKFS